MQLIAMKPAMGAGGKPIKPPEQSSYQGRIDRAKSREAALRLKTLATEYKLHQFAAGEVPGFDDFASQLYADYAACSDQRAKASFANTIAQALRLGKRDPEPPQTSHVTNNLIIGDADAARQMLERAGLVRPMPQPPPPRDVEAE